MEKEYWEKYYLSHKNPLFETLFAKEIEKYLEKGKNLIELGCGNGRDSIYFSKKGLKVLGIDQCKEEIFHLNKIYSSKNLSFKEGDFTRLFLNEKFDYVYSRFTLHSIDEKAENRVFEWIKRSLNKGGLLLLEVRSVRDELYEKGLKKENNVSITDHYRRFAEFDKLKNKLKNLEFEILDSIESKGLAPHKNEDPLIIRIISKKITQPY